MFDALFGTASKWYDEGEVAPGSTIDTPAILRPFLQFLTAHYSRDANLGYTARDTDCRLYVKGRAGVQQGDPTSSSLFSFGLHP
eukprot:3450960-Rhodomonas_salina.1